MPKIKEVICENSKPVLVNFQNGKICPTEDMALESTLFKEKNSNKKLVGVGSGDMLYAGEVTEDVNYNTFLVIQKENSKDLQLIQIDTCTVAPVFDNISTAPSTSPVKSTASELKKQFGSKKAKRHLEQQERLTMNIENVKEHLEKTVADLNLVEVPVSTQDEGESIYKPKINRNASTKDQVYLLADLVPLEVLDSLEERVSEILESDDLKDCDLLPTVETYMAALRRSSFPELVVINKCKILLFINYLVKFTITPMKSITKRFNACQYSEAVDKHLKQHYMINGLRPLSMRDKSLCYTIVLFMLVMDYEVDLEPIAKDCKQGLKKMQELARNLGFSQSTKTKSGIVLKIPVPPPVSLNLKRKRAK